MSQTYIPAELRRLVRQGGREKEDAARFHALPQLRGVALDGPYGALVQVWSLRRVQGLI
jgi:hypothetical protein